MSGLKQTLRFITVFIAYSVCAKMGLSLSPVSGFATLIWPPTGIALAATLLFGPSVGPRCDFLGGIHCKSHHRRACRSCRGYRRRGNTFGGPHRRVFFGDGLMIGTPELDCTSETPLRLAIFGCCLSPLVSATHWNSEFVVGPSEKSRRQVGQTVVGVVGRRRLGV